MREIRHFQRDTMKKFPVLKKTGAISDIAGEATPFIYKNRMLLLENRWGGYKGVEGPCASICDYFTRELLAVVGGKGYRFSSAYCENDRVYV